MRHEENDPTSERATPNDPATFGGCPECHGNDGFLNVKREQFFVCHEHEVFWLFGENLSASWKHESQQDWDSNVRLLSTYREVEAVYPEQSPDLDF